MAHIYKCEEWESNGKWHCGDVSALAADSNKWWYPCNILNITPVEFVLLLKNTYHASDFHYSLKYDVLSYSFSSLADCRKYKNMINKKAKEQNFVTY